MMKKIQQYLLLNYPIVWNTKFVPVVSLAIVCHLLFFFFGYNSNSIDFLPDYSYYSSNFGSGLFYFSAVTTSILFLILWLIFYLRQNGLHSFYPKTNKAIYFEWLLTAVIVFSISSFSFSFYEGGIVHQRSYASQSETNKAVDVLNKVSILIPESEYDYTSEELPENQDSDRETHPSLLNAREFNQIYLVSINNYDQTTGASYMKRLLKNQQADSIRLLMDEFMALQKKHGLVSNITTDQWFKLVYNPPHYPVTSANLISKSSSESNYLSYTSLVNGYLTIKGVYESPRSDILLIIAWIAILISSTIYSVRITSGKSWLISIVVNGVWSLMLGLTALVLSSIFSSWRGPSSLVPLWLLSFVAVAMYMIYQVGEGYKGKISAVGLNLFIRLLLILPFVVYLNYFSESDSNMRTFASIYLVIVFPIMWGVTVFAKKWKGLPED